MSTQNDASLTLTFPSDRETVITRVFDAPRKLVFAAMTQPEHVRQWYGLYDHTMKVCEIDLRVGGKWRYVVQMPDGNEFAFSGEYLEIVPPERLVSTEWFEAIPGSDYVATVTFTEKDGKTTLTNHLRYKTPEHRDGHVNSGMEWGMRQTFARLDEHLVDMATTDREIVLTRTFDAPRDLVFQAWTDPAHIDQWWGPNGYRNETYEMDVRPGGMWRYVMHAPDGTDYDNRSVYHEVVAPERLVYTQGSDVEADPSAFHVTVTFEPLGNKTRLTIRMRFATAEQRAATVAFGAIELGQQTLARFAEHLQNMR
jgi:uncharacterized protein YndB with AHSA1/START domain